MRENSAKYYVAESMWMIIDEFMTQKAGKYSQFVNSVTVTSVTMYNSNGVIHFGHRMTCVIIYCPQHSWCHATHWMFLHKIMLQGIKNYQYKVSM